MTTETTAAEATPATPSRVKKTVAKKTATKTAKKATKKAAPKKAPVKKASKPSTNGEAKLSKTQEGVLKILSKGKALSRTQLSEALDGAWVGSDLMGHLDPSQQKPRSLSARGLVKAQQHEGEPITYLITAAGKKAVNG